MRSSVFTATALFASVSLVVSRPQSTRLQTRDLTDDFGFNLGASPNAFTVPSPSDFLPDQSSPSLFGFSNLGFTAPGTLGAVPQEATEIQDSFGSTGVSTDYTKTIGLPNDGSFDVASHADWESPVVSSAAQAPFTVNGDAIKRSVDSITKGDFTYGIFGVSNDRKTLVPTILSDDSDWSAFGQTVRKAKPSYVLHPVSDGMLLILTVANNMDNDANWQALILDSFLQDFEQFVETQSREKVLIAKVASDLELQDTINYYSKVAPVELIQ